MKEYNGGNKPKLYYYGVKTIIISTENGLKIFNSNKTGGPEDFYFYDDLFYRNAILHEILGKDPYTVFNDVENDDIDSYAENYEIIEI